MNNLTLEQKYRIDLPGTLSLSGWSEVKEKIYQLNLPTPPLDVVGTGWMENGRKFSTRYKAWLQKEFRAERYSKKDNDISAVGEVFRRNCNRTEFDMTPTTFLNWRAGDFADGDSCFWGNRSLAREIFMRENVWALLIRNTEGHGIGRCWCKPFGNYYALFNGYGVNLSTIARGLNIVVDGKYKRYKGMNNDQSDGVVYMNGTIYVVGDPLPASNSDYFDLHIPTDNVMMCCYCGKFDFKDRGAVIESRDGTKYNYCGKCANTESRCERCSREFKLKELIRGVCAECLNPSGYITELEMQNRMRNLHWLPSGNARRCYSCGLVLHGNHQHPAQGNIYCQNHCPAHECNPGYAETESIRLVHRFMTGTFSAVIGVERRVESRDIRTIHTLIDDREITFHENIVTGAIAVEYASRLQQAWHERVASINFDLRDDRPRRWPPTTLTFVDFTAEAAIARTFGEGNENVE